MADVRSCAVANGIPYEEIGRQDLPAREPLILGLAALFFPDSAARITALGGEVRLNAHVTSPAETAAGGVGDGLVELILDGPS